MPGRSHKIWVEATGGSSRGFGCGNDDDIRMDIYVGSSATHSEKLSMITIRKRESDTDLKFEIIIDGQQYRQVSFNKKTKEFTEILGKKINGSVQEQKKREEESSNSFLRTVAGVAAMGDILAGDSKAAKNDWKARMLKAGLENKGLIMPDDWESLSEEEKEKRLNGAIKELSK